MSSITRNNFSIHSNSKGNLLKTEYQKDGIVYFVKSGRLQVRDFPEKWGIEPVIEVLCYEIGKLMGLNVAEQSLIGMEGIRYGKNFRTLVCSSPDFRNGKTLIYLASLYAEDESNIDFEKLCRNTGCGNDLINLLAFDLIIMIHTLCAACFVLIFCFQLRHRNRLTGVAEIPVHFGAFEVADDLTLVVAHGHEKPPHTDAFKIDFKTSIFRSLNSIILSPHTPRPGE